MTPEEAKSLLEKKQARAEQFDWEARAHDYRAKSYRAMASWERYEARARLAEVEEERAAVRAGLRDAGSITRLVSAAEAHAAQYRESAASYARMAREAADRAGEARLRAAGVRREIKEWQALLRDLRRARGTA